MEGYRCIICGYLLQEDKLDEDFVCPVCGAGSEDFVVEDEKK